MIYINIVVVLQTLMLYAKFQGNVHMHYIGMRDGKKKKLKKKAKQVAQRATIAHLRASMS